MMPGFQHKCFISYSHPDVADPLRVDRHWRMEFVTALKDKLQDYLGLSTYWDRKLRPGESYPSELAQNLCQSVCMIAILEPDYLESGWCLAEWQAMEKLEKKRKAGVGESIIPVHFRGQEEIISKFAGTRVFVDFTYVEKPRIDLDTKASRRTLQTLDQRIKALDQKVAPIDCGPFLIKVGKNVANRRLDGPSPF
jgi:hypothetical protein